MGTSCIPIFSNICQSRRGSIWQCIKIPLTYQTRAGKLSKCSLIWILELILTTQNRRCFIHCRLALDMGYIWEQWKGNHFSLETIISMIPLLELSRDICSS